MFRPGSLRWITITTIFVLSGLNCPADRRPLAQDSSEENWDVGRIYVREDDQGRQIPSDFWPIEIGELELRLEEIRKMRMQRALNPAFLEQATYLALLHRDCLLSEKSRWQLHSAGGNSPIVLDGVSFVLTEARNLPDSGIQLSSSNMRFRTDGKLDLLTSSPSETRWFGFQNVGVLEGGVTRFELKVPPALLGRMLIATDATQELSSIDTVVEPVENPDNFLPDDWGDITLPSSATAGGNPPSINQSSHNGQMQWWLVRLSGVSKFTLDVFPKTLTGSAQLHHALLKSEIKYAFDEAAVSVLASFEPMGSSRQPMMVRLDRSLRLVEALADGRVLDWRLVESPTESSFVQFAVDSSAPPKKIELQAIGSLPTQVGSSGFLESRDIPLPEVAMVNSHTLHGITTVTGSGSCRVTQVLSKVDYAPVHSPFSLPTSQPPQELGNESTAMEWSGHWSGKPQTADARLAKNSSEWQLEGLTRLSVREESITSTMNVRITGNRLESNMLLLPVASYWMADSALIVDDVDKLFHLRLRNTPDGKQQIEITWQHAAESVQFQLLILARRPNEATDKPLVIDQSMSIAVPQGSCWMNYVVEEHDDYHLRFSPQVIQMSISQQDLPAWQQRLVSDSSQPILKDSSNGIRLLLFDKQHSDASMPLPNLAGPGDKIQEGGQNQPDEPKLDVPSSQGSNADSWIWSETLDHRFFDSGQVAHELILELQSRRDSQLSINVPDDWDLQAIVTDDQEMDTYRWQPGLLQLRAIVEGRSQLRIRWTSQELPLGWYGQLAVGSPVYSMPLLKRKQTVWISPKNCLLSWSRLLPEKSSESGTQSEIAPGVASKWNPARWLRLPDILGVSGENAEMQWDKTELESISQGTAGEQSAEQIFWIGDRNALRTLNWVVLAMLSVISWILLRRSLRIWWIAFTLTLAGSLLLPEQYQLLSQLFLLSLVLGCLCRMVERIVHPTRTPSHDVHGSRPAITGCLLLLAIGSSDFAMAQPTAEEESGLSGPNATYAVFIPSDAEQKPVGEYAYIPKQLRDLLYFDNSMTSEAEGSYLLSANYSIRLGQRDRDSDVVQSCSVDMRVLINRANSEILIPIKGKGLAWTGIPLLNGQARVWGGRNFSPAPDGSGVRFRAETVGEIELKLEFRPEVVEDGDDRFRLLVDIPEVATSKLRIISSSSVSNLSTNSKGLVQRTFLGDTIANIGPVDRLDISWSYNQRTANIAPAEQVSETWMLSQSDQILAGCQLTVERSQSLPRELDLIINGDWQPMGDSWKDVDLIGVSHIGSQARTVCRVRQKESARDSCTIQLLLVPNQKTESSRMSAPFVVLDRVNTKSTYFWWSGDGMSKWVPEVSEFPTIRNEVTPNWGSFALSPQRAGYQIFGTPVVVRSQSSPLPGTPLSEVNSLRLRRNQTVIHYVANWEPTGNQPDQIVVHLPECPTTPELEINGVPAKFTMDSNRRLMKISMKDNGIGRLGRLRVALYLPSLQNQVHAVPRISLSRAPAKQSLYEIYQGLGMDVRVAKETLSAVFVPADRSSVAADSLDELDLRLGQFDISQQPTQDGYFPLSLEVSQVDDAQPASEVLFLDSGTDLWRATYRSVWDHSQETPNFAFFDLPLTARDGLTSNKSAFKFIPHSDPNRTRLCIPMALDSGQQPWVEFSIPLTEAAGSRAIALPLIQAIGRPRPTLLGLPKSVNGEPVEWQGVARRETDTQPEWFGPASEEAFELYSIGSDVTAVSWHPVNERTQQSKLLGALVDVSDGAPDHLAGVIHYWMDVGASEDLCFDLPEGCTVVGVLSNGSNLHWTVTDSQLVISVPGSRLPYPIQVVAEWKLEDSMRVRVPTIGRNFGGGSLFVFPPENPEWKIVSGELSGAEISREHLANRWARTIVAAAQTLSNTPSDATAAWMAQWYPSPIGIANQWVITDSSVLQDSLSVDLNSDGALTVEELWKSLEMVVEPTNTGLSSENRSIPSIANRVPLQLVADEFTFEHRTPNAPVVSQNGNWRFAALAALAMIATIPWFFEKWLSQLVRLPGVNWLILSVLLGSLISFYWLSILAALIGSWQLIGHFLFVRHRVQRI